MWRRQLRSWLGITKAAGPTAGRRRIPLTVEGLEDRTLPSGLPLLAATTTPDASTQTQVAAAFMQVPLSFEANQGQTDAAVNFLARGQGYGLFLTSTAAVLSLNSPTGERNNAVGMQLIGANPAAVSAGLDPQAGAVNYFIGDDPTQWHSNVSTFGRAQYHDVYDGVDVVYYGNQGQLEYDFTVAPGANAGQIRLGFTGTSGMGLDSGGNLVLHTTGGDVVEQAPVLYQTTATGRQSVSGAYVLLGNGQVGFQIGAYDATLPLVIDPALSYSTYLGGSLGDKALAVAVDANGNAYITGETGSPNFPTTSGTTAGSYGINKGQNTETDVFVTKLNPAGALVYTAFLGGSSDDHGTGIAVDSSGNAYICGWTSQSTDYPVTTDAFQTAYDHRQDGFVTKLNATGSALVYSTYLGGGADDEPHAIAVDSQGFAYIAGDTFSTDFPTQNPIQGGVNNSNDDAFLTKLNQTGTALVYSTYLRGSGNDAATGVAVDNAGEAIVVGYTESLDFPTTANAFQKNRGGDPAQNVANTFVTKINAAGTGYVYSTYLGGSVGALFAVENGGPAVATDSSGAAYVTGDTSDPDFPVTADAAQQTKNFTDMFGLSSAFVTKFDTNGGMVYSTYLGGGGLNTEDGGRGIAVDAQGNAYVTGFTADTSTPFPIAFPIQTTPGQPASFAKPGNVDAFVTRVSADGSNFDYSSYLGGVTYDFGRGIALDGNGNVYVVGITRSFASADGGTVDNFPMLNALDSTPPSDQTGDYTGFVSRVNLLEPDAGTIYFPDAVTETTATGKFVTIQVARRDGDTAAANITYATSDGTAKSGTNYTSESGTLSFAAGQHVATFTVPIVNDGVNDNTPFLVFHLTLSNPTNGAVLDNTDNDSTADVHIYGLDTANANNDLFDNAIPLVGSSVSVTGSNVGASTNTGDTDIFDFPVTDSKSVSNPKNDGGASVWWIWSPPTTAMATIDTFGSDFDTLLSVFSLNQHLVENDDATGRTDGTSSVTFLAIEGQAYRICVQGYDFGGGAETGNITLNINGSASAGSLQFSQQSYTVNETAGSLTIPVSRTGGSTGAVSVLFSTSDGTAHAGTNYTAVNQTLTWAAGDTTTQNVTIPITNNGSTGQSPTFNVSLSDATGGAGIGSPNSAVVVIIEGAAGSPSFTSGSSTAFTVGAQGSFTVTASGSPKPTLSESGSDTLPSGVTFTASTGVLAGIPADGSAGTYTLHFTAQNSKGSATQTFTLTVNQAPAITSANSTTFTAGTQASFSVTASGAPPPTLSEIGSDTLPSGVTFTPATGVLAGTPAAGSGGTYTLHFTAANGVGNNATQTFTLTVNQSAAFTSAASTTFAVGSSGSFTVSASGTPAPALSESGSDTLPSGVTFTAATGVLAGTPAAGTVGTYSLHFTAANGVGNNTTQTFTLTVNQAPAITSANSTAFTAGTAGNFTVTASGAPAPTLGESGSDTLPSGVTFTPATGILAGTPAAGSGGTYALHFTAHNGVGNDASQTFTLTVNQAPAFTSATSTAFAVGSSGSFTVTANGTPAPALSENAGDTLPSGVTFTAATGVLAGKPAVGSAGTYTLHFTAHNGIGADATQTFTLTVTTTQPPAFTSGNATSLAVGTSGSFTVTASGVPAPTLSESNSDTLPSGVTFTAATGILAGTPAAGSAGSYTLHFTGHNGVGSDANQTFTLTVNQVPAFTSAGSTTFTTGTAGSFSVTASGAPAPTLSENNSDTLPSGVTFTASTGVLSGTPAANTGGTYTLHFTAANGVGSNATQTFTLKVNQAPAITSASSTAFTAGTAGNFSLTASGAPLPTLSESGSDTLPSGVTFTPATGILAGTPAAGSGGTYALHFTAHNGMGSDATQTFMLTINQGAAFTSASSTAFAVGSQGSFTVSASGTPPPALSESASDTLPSGVTFTSATGVLSGTPAAGSGGTYTLHFTAHNGIGADATQTFTLTVTTTQPPAFTSANATSFAVGAAGTFTVTASGIPAPALSESNSDTLPSGVTFTAATGMLAGTPAAGSGGTYTLHFTAHNGAGADATQTFTLTVNEPPAFTSANNASFSPGTAGSFTVAASGTPPPTLSEANGDTLPSGVTFAPATGLLSGTPAAGAAGTYTLHFTAHNGIGADATQTFTLTVSPANFIYDASTMTLTITANAATNSFTFAQATSEDASNTLHTTYRFTLNGVTQTFTDAQVNRVFVNGLATGSNTAILITNDTYVDNKGATQETRETISLGAKNQSGVGTMQKYDATGKPFTFLTLTDFPISYAYVGRNDGTVSLYGTAGVAYNGFVSAGNYSYIGGPGLFHLAQGATSVYGYSAGQTADFAYHYSANAGSAFVVSGTAFSYLSAMDTVNGVTQPYFNVGVGFLVNTGVSKNPGKDYAYIIDSPGNDSFVGGTGYSYMYLQNLDASFAELDTAYAFALVFAESFVGGIDVAINGDPNKNILGGKWTMQ